MMWTVRYAKEAIADLKKLDKVFVEQVLKDEETRKKVISIALIPVISVVIDTVNGILHFNKSDRVS